MLKTLVSDFRRGIVDLEKIRKLEADPFKHFELQEVVGVRPSVLRYLLPLDNKFLKDVFDDVANSRDAGKRVGRDWMPIRVSRIETKNESDANWVSTEDLKPLNDVCTKWCTRKYFPDAFMRVNMIANVVRLYDRLREITGLQFHIIFKGGVMIRLILLEFFNDLTPEARLKATEYMNEQQALSISDFDFEIVPDDHHLPDQDYHRYSIVSYAVLLWLQRAMQNELERGMGKLMDLSWRQEENSIQELGELLQRQVNALHSDSSLHKATIDYVCLGDTPSNPPRGYSAKNGKNLPSSRKNVLIFDCDQTKCVLPASCAFEELGINGVPCKSGGTLLYATLNTYIGDDYIEGVRPGQIGGIFHLARIKHSFVVYYTTRAGKKCCDRLGGEMIDMSLSHTHLDAARRSMYNAVSTPYRNYPILGVDPKIVILRSYSTEAFLFDHQLMLHNTDMEPWEVKKREKRMARYVSFLFVCVFSSSVRTTYTNKIKGMQKMVQKTKSLKEMLSSPVLNTGIKHIDQFAAVERKSLEYAPKALAKPYLNTLHQHLHVMLSIMMIQSANQQNLPLLIADYDNMHRHIFK